MPKPNYNAMITLLQFTCHYCGKVATINPNEPGDTKTVAEMLKVQTADGASYQFCNSECLRPGTKWFRDNPLEPVNEAANEFGAQPATGIILTDADQDVFDSAVGPDSTPSGIQLV